MSEEKGRFLPSSAMELEKMEFFRREGKELGQGRRRKGILKKELVG